MFTSLLLRCIHWRFQDCTCARYGVYCTEMCLLIFKCKQTVFKLCTKIIYKKTVTDDVGFPQKQYEQWDFSTCEKHSRSLPRRGKMAHVNAVCTIGRFGRINRSEFLIRPNETDIDRRPVCRSSLLRRGGPDEKMLKIFRSGCGRAYAGGSTATPGLGTVRPVCDIRRICCCRRYFVASYTINQFPLPLPRPVGLVTWRRPVETAVSVPRKHREWGSGAPVRAKCEKVFTTDFRVPWRTAGFARLMYSWNYFWSTAEFMLTLKTTFPASWRTLSVLRQSPHVFQRTTWA